MSLEEKREFYLVKKFVELKDVKTWKEYFTSHKDQLKETCELSITFILEMFLITPLI